MSRDLASLLHDTVEENERSLGTVDDVFPSVRRRVGRRRAVRHVVGGAGVLMVAALVSIGTWSGLHHEPAPPAEPRPGPAPIQLGLPRALELPDGMLEQARDGWVLTVEAPTSVGSDDETTVVNQSVDLLTPQGDRYRVTELPTDRAYELLSWLPGETTALVGDRQDERESTSEVDLRTGATRELYSGMPRRDSAVVGRDLVWIADEKLYVAEGTDPGRELASVGKYARRLWGDPTGTRVAMLTSEDDKDLAVVDVGSGDRTDVTVATDLDSCGVVSWFDAANILLVCGDTSIPGLLDPPENPRLYLLDVDSGRTTLQHDLSDGTPVPQPEHGSWVRDGLVATAVFDDRCSAAVGLWDGDDFTSLQRASSRPQVDMTPVAAGGQVFVAENDSCFIDAPATTLTAHDLSTGTSTTLAAPPADTPPTGTAWRLGMSSMIVGGAS